MSERQNWYVAENKRLRAALDAANAEIKRLVGERDAALHDLGYADIGRDAANADAEALGMYGLAPDVGPPSRHSSA